MLHTRAVLCIASLLTVVNALPATSPNDNDLACFSSYQDYTSSSLAFGRITTTGVVSIEERISRSIDADVPWTTLCDGRRRALEPYKTFEVTSTVTLDPPRTTTGYSTYDSPSPTCTIACSMDPDACAILGWGPHTLFYWPVTTVSGDFCAQNGSTVFAEPTSPPEPDTVVRDGYTFTSPTNYISFAGARAVIRRSHPEPISHPCGPPVHTNVIVPITESFYSQGYYDSGKRSFNFADLAPNPIPVSAYRIQGKCGQKKTCTGAIVGSYTPILPLPTEILNLEPEGWKGAGCTGTNLGYSFTPIALATPTPTASI